MFRTELNASAGIQEGHGDQTASNLIGGAQLATMTFFAPTSFAICTISFEVVPRTIESRQKTVGT